MFVVMGATGNTGSVVAKTLLQEGKPVRVVVRDAARGAAWKERGAEVAIADSLDVAALTQALRGADGVYVMVPPDRASNTVLEGQRRVVDAYAQAITAARPKHLVLLSSVAAHLPGGTGPIRSVHYAEQRLAPLGVPLTAVRAAYFLENWAAMLQPVLEQSVLPTMLRPDQGVEMVATADIGRVAAEALLRGPEGHAIVELAGPAAYTPRQIAAAFSSALGRPIQLVEVPEAGIVPALTGAGLTQDLAALYREMIIGLNADTVRFERTPHRGTVGAEAVVRQLVAGAKA
jgi:uncharacterized protein YbjT (DUF2867 family)